MDIRPVSNGQQTAPVAEKYNANGVLSVVAAKTAVATETTNAVQQPTSIPSLEQAQEAVKNINQTMQALSQDLEFSIDKESDRMIVKVVDQKTQEVIRQMPTQEALDIAKALDKVQGLLIRQKA